TSTGVASTSTSTPDPGPPWGWVVITSVPSAAASCLPNNRQATTPSPAMPAAMTATVAVPILLSLSAAGRIMVSPDLVRSSRAIGGRTRPGRAGLEGGGASVTSISVFAEVNAGKLLAAGSGALGVRIGG